VMLSAHPLPSNRHHRSNGDCVEGKRENYRVCSVQYCVQRFRVKTSHCQNVLSSKRPKVITSPVKTSLHGQNVPSQIVPILKPRLHDTTSCCPTGCHTGCTSYNRLHQLCRVKIVISLTLKKLLKLRISICVYDYSTVGDRMKPLH